MIYVLISNIVPWTLYIVLVPEKLVEVESQSPRLSVRCNIFSFRNVYISQVCSQMHSKYIIKFWYVLLSSVLQIWFIYNSGQGKPQKSSLFLNGRAIKAPIPLELHFIRNFGRQIKINKRTVIKRSILFAASLIYYSDQYTVQCKLLFYLNVRNPSFPLNYVHNSLYLDYKVL